MHCIRGRGWTKLTLVVLSDNKYVAYRINLDSSKNNINNQSLKRNQTQGSSSNLTKKRGKNSITIEGKVPLIIVFLKKRLRADC